MASSTANGGGGEEEAKRLAAELAETLKEGERLLAPTRRPDGTLRKAIRIRAGYVPQEEVPIYQSKGALWRKEMTALQEVPPGYDPVIDAPKAKSKAAKRNERKKEKRMQAALEKGNDMEDNCVLSAETENHVSNEAESVAARINELAISSNPVDPPSNSTESSTTGDHLQDIDKKIRALKKKIRLAEAQQQKTEKKDMNPDQLEKMAKLEGWHTELKFLLDKRAELAALVT